MRMAEDVTSAQYSNNLMEELFDQKLLSFNHSKSQFLVMGNRSARKKIRHQLEKNPLILCSEKMHETNALKYLGDYLSFDLEDSVFQTITKRVGIVKQTTLEIRSVIEDSRADNLGPISLAFDIWEQAIVPMLLLNSESWLKISKKSMKVLDNLFHEFCQKIFRVGSGCPKPSYYWESGTQKFSTQILHRKLVFVHHLANLSPQSLGRQVIDVQIEKKIGLFKEVEEHLTAMGVINLQELSKWQMKRKVKCYTNSLSRRELLDEIQRYKKLDYSELVKEPLKRKSYFSSLSLENARMRFRVASSFVQSVRTNFSRKYGRTSLDCPACTVNREAERSNNREADQPEPIRDSQNHILSCFSYSDLRGEQFDPKDDQMLAEFFRKVVQRRVENSQD